MDNCAHIVVAPDGTILAVSDHFPAGVVGRHLRDCVELPPTVRDTCDGLQRRWLEAGTACESVTLPQEPTRVLVLMVAAVGLRRADTNLRELLSAKLGIISAQAKASGVALRVKVADDVPTVVDLDPEKIAWAVTTLVGNALRYVHSTTRRLAGKLVAVRVGFDAASSAIAISVDDDGPGIPEDTVRRLFDRDGLNVRGAGLALLVIRDVLAAHGGTVNVRSSTDPIAHGTAIRLVLPVRVPNHQTMRAESAVP